MTTFKVTFHQDPSEEGAKSFDGVTGTLAQCVAHCIDCGFSKAEISAEEMEENIITLFRGDSSSDFATIELV